MCMITTAAEVSSTRIFARLNDGEQIIVYQNKMLLGESGAMILPIPEASSKDDAVTFINLEKHPEFFTHLESCFKDPSFRRRGARTKSFSADSLSLKVEKVGAFIASFVPTLADFERLNPAFRLSADVWDKLPQYEDFGFVVFQFQPGKVEPHPMAFRFKTGFTDAVYYPTVHVHDGEVHEEDRFDHKLYLQATDGSGSLATTLDDISDPSTLTEGWHRQHADATGAFAEVKKTGLFDNDTLLWRRELHGKLPNKDFYVKVQS